MSEYSKRQVAYMDTVAANTPPLYPHLSCGWPDAEYALSWSDYIDNCIALIDELPEGADVGTFLTYREWVIDRRPDDGDLGFCRDDCELCGALPGNRHAVTALPSNPRDNHDYVALMACSDCLQYIANAEVPDF